MKAFITLSFICLTSIVFAYDAIHLSEDQRSQFKADLQECITQENVSDEEAVKINQFDVDDPSAEMKCAIACFFEKFGALKDNKVQVEFVEQKLNPIINEERTKELIRRCKDAKSADRCETGIKIFECVWNYRAF